MSKSKNVTESKEIKKQVVQLKRKTVIFRAFLDAPQNSLLSHHNDQTTCVGREKLESFHILPRSVQKIRK